MPDALWFTDDEDACRLLAEDPFALLVGFALDQQITVQQAFLGPLRLAQRLGTLEPSAVAEADLEPLFREKPAIHRFPGSMAGRVRELAALVRDEYDGDASRLWTEAKDGADLRRRIAALPKHGRFLPRCWHAACGHAMRRRYNVNRIIRNRNDENQAASLSPPSISAFRRLTMRLSAASSVSREATRSARSLCT